MIKINERRPDIPKLRIVTIGGFVNNQPDCNWSFDGGSNPKSVGKYISCDWLLIAGYTVQELREIAAENKQS